MALAGHDSPPLTHGKWQLPAGKVPGDALQSTPGPTVPGATSASVADEHTNDASTSPSFGTAE